jgi:hypothetical protein
MKSAERCFNIGNFVMNVIALTLPFLQRLDPHKPVTPIEVVIAPRLRAETRRKGFELEKAELGSVDQFAALRQQANRTFTICSLLSISAAQFPKLAAF